MIIKKCQEEILKDKRKSGKERPWAVHKVNNIYLAIAYDDVDVKKAGRLRDCASWLEFFRTEEGLKLHNANFCRVRLCPICAWRRSLKTYGQVRKIVSVAQEKYAFIFLTLTVRNCNSDYLSETLDSLSRAWNKFIGYKDIKNVVKGYYRATEVTHNLEHDTYHPHFHCLLAVNKSYFTNRTYMKHDKWVELWKKALKVDYEPQVNVQRVKGNNIDGICAEVAKYTTKSSDIICFDDWDLTVDTVRVLDKAFNKRRFIAFGGVFKDIHKQLNLDDVEDGDLIHDDDDEPELEAPVDTVLYAWHSGYSQYIKS